MRNVHVKVLAAAALVVAGLGATAFAVPTIDGTLDASGYTRIATQTVNSGFGDNTGSGGGSELDALYFNVDDAAGKISFFVSGNLETNNNKLVFFFDTQAGGQNTLRTDNPDVNFNNLNYRYGAATATGGVALPGFTFDTAFSSDYFLSFSRDGGKVYTDFAQTQTTGGGIGGFVGEILVPSTGFQQGSGTVGGGSLPVMTVGYDDSNVLGVNGNQGTPADTTAAQSVTTGMEFTIDLAALGIVSDFRITAFINGQNHDYLSNQFLPGLAGTATNLASDGLGNFVAREGTSDGTVAGVNLANIAGDQYLTVSYTAPVSTWILNDNGSYDTPANWSPAAVPNGTGGRAVFGSAITLARTVTLASDVTLGSLTFDNTNAYTLAGTNTLTIAGSAAAPAVTVLSGNHVISSPVVLSANTRVSVATGSSLTLSGSLDATGRDLFKSGDGTLSVPAVNMNSVSVNAGTVKLTGTGSSVMTGVTVDTGATLDIGSAALIVDYNEFYTPLNTIKPYLQDGRVTSGLLVGNSNRAIGYLDTASSPTVTSYNGVPLDSLALVFVATIKGDATLDKSVGFDDLLALAQNYDAAYDPNVSPPKVWAQGDFDYNGIVNFDDLLSLAQNYNGSLGSSSLLSADFAADWALAQSLVPEPTTFAAVGGLGSLFLRRRRSI